MPTGNFLFHVKKKRCRSPVQAALAEFQASGKTNKSSLSLSSVSVRCDWQTKIVRSPDTEEALGGSNRGILITSVYLGRGKAGPVTTGLKLERIMW